MGEAQGDGSLLPVSATFFWQPFCHYVDAFGHVFLGKTKTLQTVTLRVAILSDFSARRLSQNFGAKLKQKSAQVRAVFSWKFAGTE